MWDDVCCIVFHDGLGKIGYSSTGAGREEVLFMTGGPRDLTAVNELLNLILDNSFGNIFVTNGSGEDRKSVV